MTDTFWQFYLLNEKKSLLYVYLILEWGMYNDLTKQNVFGETCVFGLLRKRLQAASEIIHLFINMDFKIKLYAYYLYSYVDII